MNQIFHFSYHWECFSRILFWPYPDCHFQSNSDNFVHYKPAITSWQCLHHRISPRLPQSRELSQLLSSSLRYQSRAQMALHLRQWPLLHLSSLQRLRKWRTVALDCSHHSSGPPLHQTAPRRYEAPGPRSRRMESATRLALHWPVWSSSSPTAPISVANTQLNGQSTTDLHSHQHQWNSKLHHPVPHLNQRSLHLSCNYDPLHFHLPPHLAGTKSCAQICSLPTQRPSLG